MTYPQTLHMTDRLDYLSAHQNRHALCMCIEDAMQLEVPQRAQYIRTMMDELMRISSHLLFSLHCAWTSVRLPLSSTVSGNGS